MSELMVLTLFLAAALPAWLAVPRILHPCNDQ